MLLDKVFRPRNTSSPSWLVDWIRGTSSDTGVQVDGTTVLTYAPWFQAVSVISGDLGQLPLKVYARMGEGKKEVDKLHPGHLLMSHRANDTMLPNVLKELLQSWVLLWGNGCAAIERTGSRPTALYPLLPDRTYREKGEDDGIWWYVTKVDAKFYRFRPENVLHIMGLTGDGIWGKSVIELARNSVGLGLAQEKHGARSFKNAARPAGIIKRPQAAGDMSKVARDNFRKEWNAMYEGLDNVGKTAILAEGMEFQPLSIANIDAQWLQSMQFSREQSAAWFNLPPHKLGAMEKSSVRANLEEQNRDYLNTTLMRWLVKWEEECNAKLLTKRQRDLETRFFKWNPNALLRADTKARYEAYMIARTAGFMSPNEIRDLEDMNRREDEGGDSYDNPNTSSPKGGGAIVKQPDDEQQEILPIAASVRNAHRELLLDRARQLVAVEIRRVTLAAKRTKNFCGWVDEFYGGFAEQTVDFLGLAVNAARSSGLKVGDLSLVGMGHGEESRKRLLEMAGMAFAGELSSKTEQVLTGWDTRAVALVDRLLGDNDE